MVHIFTLTLEFTLLCCLNSALVMLKINRLNYVKTMLSPSTPVYNLSLLIGTYFTAHFEMDNLILKLGFVLDDTLLP